MWWRVGRMYVFATKMCASAGWPPHTWMGSGLNTARLTCDNIMLAGSCSASAWHHTMRPACHPQARDIPSFPRSGASTTLSTRDVHARRVPCREYALPPATHQTNPPDPYALVALPQPSVCVRGIQTVKPNCQQARLSSQNEPADAGSHSSQRATTSPQAPARAGTAVCSERCAHTAIEHAVQAHRHRSRQASLSNTAPLAVRNTHNPGSQPQHLNTTQLPIHRSACVNSPPPPSVDLSYSLRGCHQVVGASNRTHKNNLRACSTAAAQLPRAQLRTAAPLQVAAHHAHCTMAVSSCARPVLTAASAGLLLLAPSRLGLDTPSGLR